MKTAQASKKLALLTSIIWLLQTGWTLTVTSRENSPDLIGFMQAECQMQLEEDTNPATNACDFNMGSFYRADSTRIAETESIYDRMFVVKWLAPVLVQSFFVDCYPQGMNVTVYVPADLPFQPGADSLAKADFFPNGVYSLPSQMRGIALVFEPIVPEEIGLTFREIRVWSAPEIGSISKVSGSHPGFVGASPAVDFNLHSGQFYIDLKAVKNLEAVWIMFHTQDPKNGLNFCVFLRSFLYAELDRQCFSLAKENQEEYLTPQLKRFWENVRYVEFCKADSLDPAVAKCVTVESLFRLRKVAIFQYIDPCSNQPIAFTALKPPTTYQLGSGPQIIQKVPSCSQTGLSTIGVEFQMKGQIISSGSLPFFMKAAKPYPSLNIESSNPDNVGLYIIRQTEFFIDNPFISAFTEFAVKVQPPPCTQSQFIFVPGYPDRSYQVGDEPALFALPVVESSLCHELEVTYKFSFTIGGNKTLGLPSFLTQNNGNFEVQTTDFGLTESYLIEVIAEAEEFQTSLEFNFEITCRLLGVTFVKPPEPFLIEVTPGVDVYRVPFHVGKQNDCDSPVTVSIEAPTGWVLQQIDPASYEVIVPTQALADKEFYSILLSACFEGNCTSTDFSLKAQFICGQSMLPQAQNLLTFSAFIGLNMTLQLPNITDEEGLLAKNNTFCGPSSYSILGLDQLGFLSGQQLKIQALTFQQLGNYTGIYTRSFDRFEVQLSVPISIIVKQPYELEGTIQKHSYNLFKPILLSLDYRRVTYSSDALQSLFDQLSSLVPNSFYKPLLAVYLKQLKLEELRASLLSGLSIDYTVTSEQSDLASVLTPASNGTSFTFFNDRIADAKRTQVLLQQIQITRQGTQIWQTENTHSRIWLSQIINCNELTLDKLRRGGLLLDIQCLPGQQVSQFYTNVTDEQNFLADYPNLCGNERYSLTEAGSDSPAPTFLTLKMANQQIKLAPGPNEPPAVYKVDLKFTLAKIDGSELVFRQTFQASVLKGNRPPRLEGFDDKWLPPLTAQLGQPATFLMDVQDPDGDQVTLDAKLDKAMKNQTDILQFDKSQITVTLPLDFNNTEELVFISLSDGDLETNYILPIVAGTESSSAPKDDNQSKNLIPSDENDPEAPPIDDKLKPGKKNEQQKPSPKIVLVQQEILPTQAVGVWVPPAETKKIEPIRKPKGCIPFDPIVQDNGDIDFEFLSEVKLSQDEELLAQIKKAGSIQIQILKADGGLLSRQSSFDWEMTLFNAWTIRMSVLFDSPEQISGTSYGRDALKIVFKDTKQFLSCVDLGHGRRLSTMPDGYSVTIPLPPLRRQVLLKKNEEASLENIAAAATEGHAVENSVYAQLIVNQYAGLSQSLIWGGINALQVIACSGLMAVVQPPNCNLIYMFVKRLVSFDIHNPFAKSNAYTRTQPFNQEFKSLGFTTLNYFDAMGSIFVVTGAVICSHLISPAFKWLAQKARPWFVKRGYIAHLIIDNLMNLSFFKQTKYTVVHYWIRFSLETFLILMISAMLSFYSVMAIEEMNVIDKLSVYCGFLTMVVLMALSIFVLVFAAYLNLEQVRIAKTERLHQKASDLLKFVSGIVKQQDEEKKKQQEFEMAFELSKDDSVRQPLNSVEESVVDPPQFHFVVQNMCSSEEQSEPEIINTERRLLAEEPEVINTERGLLVEEKESQVLIIEEDSYISRAQPRRRESENLAAYLHRTQGHSEEDIGFQSHADISSQIHNKGKIILQSLDNQEKFTYGMDFLRFDTNTKRKSQSSSSMRSKNSDRGRSQKPKFFVQTSLIAPIPSVLTSQAKEEPSLSTPAREQEESVIAKESKVERKATITRRATITPQEQQAQKAFQRQATIATLVQMAKSQREGSVKSVVERWVRSDIARQTSRRVQQLGLFRSFKTKVKSDTFAEDEALNQMYSEDPRKLEVVFRQTKERTRAELKQLRKNQRKWFDRKYVDPLVEGLNPHNDSAAMYHFFFIFRRVALVLVAFFFKGVPSFQTIVFLLGSFMILTFQVSNRPFEDAWINKLEIFNESVVLLVAYYNIILLIATFNVDQLLTFGTVINITIATQFLVNMLLLLIDTVAVIKKALKKFIDFFKLRKRAKVHPSFEKRANRIMQRKANGKFYFAFFPDDEIPKAGDIDWLFREAYHPFEFVSSYSSFASVSISSSECSVSSYPSLIVSITQMQPADEVLMDSRSAFDKGSLVHNNHMTEPSFIIPARKTNPPALGSLLEPSQIDPFEMVSEISATMPVEELLQIERQKDSDRRPRYTPQSLIDIESDSDQEAPTGRFGRTSGYLAGSDEPSC